VHSRVGFPTSRARKRPLWSASNLQSVRENNLRLQNIYPLCTLNGILEILAGTSLPENGEINQRFGVYKSLCCGQEIIIREGATFPDCPNHAKLSTVWTPVDFETIPTTEIKKKSESDPAA